LLSSVQQNVSAQKRFIADAAHQLRTPLAGLKSQTELAIKATDDPQLIGRLHLVHQSATRGAHLVNQLLMLARAEPEAAHMQDLAPLNFARFVKEVVVGLVPRALKADIDLGMADGAGAGTEPVLVLANALLLREAVSNVLDNAIEYAGRGSEVTVEVESSGDQARMIVSDNGPGIAPQDRERVFERFVRVAAEGTGCGLGLAIVKEIVTQHGGTVALEDVHPRGLKVVVSLPRLPAADVGSGADNPRSGA